jgi:hypothetical protein
VLTGSLPVVSFGDPSRANVATIGLNPSDSEFMDGDRWLSGSKRRLHSLVSLEASAPPDLDDEQVRVATQACYDYFTGNWLRTWFGPLEHLLGAAGVGSFLDGSACHLDLVQWATRPKQSRLPTGAWKRLVEADVGFLSWQLATYRPRALLANGSGVVRGLRDAGLAQGLSDEYLVFKGKAGPRRMRVWTGRAGASRLLGWSMPLAQPISRDGRAKLSRWVGQNLLAPREMTP